ncbi:MAG TPA: CHAT domain-containing tetratricopeptide repeat protein [Rhodopila sp.]|uniref:CHAT domain-containing protein n=1 Tax=Rhodopila sp. TaxID=2480087 RepID=UPI002B6391D7|nr:CHAT domain-containing tetratricopeptide repeat protein [Rhodopila sp.]HVY15088.1 CHAT domain-containing tetratricopeptide repeat protein [Rhodopila sp.]
MRVFLPIPSGRGRANCRTLRAATLPVVASLVALVAACTAPPPSAYVPSASAQGGVAVGKSASGEACRLVTSGGGGDVWCGEWQSPSARVRSAAGANLAAATSDARTGLDARLECEAPHPTTILGSHPAMLMQCRQRNGGWPAFLLTANAGGKDWQVDGVLPALPAAIQAVGVVSGVVGANQAPPTSEAIDMVARQLTQHAYTTNDLSQYDALMNAARDANQAERFTTAESAYRAALALQERVQGAGSPDTALPLMLLALQLSNQGRNTEAAALFDRAQRLVPRAADPLLPAQLMLYRGLAEANQRHTDAALADFSRAEAQYAPFLPAGVRGGGTASVDQGSMLAPLLVTRDVLPDPTSQRAVVGVIEARRNAAAALRAAGRTAEAQAELAKASQLAASVPGLTGADLIEARLDRTGGAVAASAGATGVADSRFAASAERFARGVPESRPYAETLLLRAGALGPKDAEALRLCRKAIGILSHLREGTSPGLIAPCVDAFVADPQDQARLAEGFEAAQLAQGAATTTQIARAAARLAEGARDPKVGAAIQHRDEALASLSALYRERDAALAQAPAGQQVDLSAYDKRIAAAEAGVDDADRTVQAAAPGFAQLVQSVTSAKDVSSVLAPGEALLLTTLPPNGHGWNFLLRDGRIAVAPVGATTSDIGKMVRAVRASVDDGAGEKPFAAGAAYQLDQAVLGGFRLDGVKGLLVVPAGPLLEIPYGILVTAPPRAPTGLAGNAYLIEQFPITHLPAAASLVALRHAGESKAPRPWIGFGVPRPMPVAYAMRSFPADPQCGRQLAALPALPGAALELSLAARIEGAGTAQPVTGQAFTANALTHADLHDYRVLHLATHGVLPSDLACLQDPVIIASAAPNGPDASQGLISAGTVLGLNLDANLVLLSACNSGGGVTAGESLSTLARAFFFAGARGLLLTHWYINDIAAARIGASMLLNMRHGESSAEALRQAQLDLLHVPEGAHPSLWGPFALVGPGAKGGAQGAGS